MVMFHGFPIKIEIFLSFPIFTEFSDSTAEGQIDGHAAGISHDRWDGRQSNDHHTQDIDGSEVEDGPIDPPVCADKMMI